MKFAPSKQIHSRGALSIAHNVQSTDEKVSSIGSYSLVITRSIKVVSCGVDGVIGVWDKSALSSDGSPKIREISDRTHSCCALYDNQVYAGFTQTDLSTGVEKQVCNLCIDFLVFSVFLGGGLIRNGRGRCSENYHELLSRCDLSQSFERLGHCWIKVCL